MPAFGGQDIGPQQIDQPIARDRARPSLEMQVEQNGKVFLAPEANGRAAASNELGRSQNVDLKLSGHEVLRPFHLRYRRGCGLG